MLGCKRLILIGDPQQLPATIFSKKCEKFGYDLSLFERLQRANYPVFLLKVITFYYLPSLIYNNRSNIECIQISPNTYLKPSTNRR